MFGRIPEISVEELKGLCDRGETPVLLDVREPHEYAVSDLPGSVKIPMGKLPQSFERLPREKDIVVYCRSGSRSADVVYFLREVGFEKARNLAGGINAWAERIDREMRTY